ncbi:hypothetical protein D4R75_04275 [bacterium]|nr:MAG: hypothetical protein D4R75_04275 [bacterium]
MEVRRYRHTVLPDNLGKMDDTGHAIGLRAGSLVDSKASESDDPVESMTVFLHLFTSVSSFGL